MPTIFQRASNSNKINIIENYLVKHGVKFIYSKYNAIIYELKDTNIVCKLVLPSDKGYISFLKLVLRNKNNKHFPIIKSCRTLKGKPFKGMYVIKMEKLINLHDDNKLRQIAFLCILISKGLSDYTINEEIKYMLTQGTYKNKKEIIKYLVKYKSFVDTLKMVINKKPPNADLDIYTSNIMKRKNGDLVLIDGYL